MFVGKCFLVVASVCVICPYGTFSASYEDGDEQVGSQQLSNDHGSHHENVPKTFHAASHKLDSSEEKQQELEEYKKQLAECDQLKKQNELEKNGGSQEAETHQEPHTHREEGQSHDVTSENPSLWNRAQGLLGLSSEAPQGASHNDNNNQVAAEDGQSSNDNQNESPTEEPPKSFLQNIMSAGANLFGSHPNKGHDSSSDRKGEQTPEDGSSLLKHAINILKELQAMEREIVKSRQSGENPAGRAEENANLLSRVKKFLSLVYEQEVANAVKKDNGGILPQLGHIFSNLQNAINPKGDNKSVERDPNTLEGVVTLKLNDKPIAIPNDENIWSKIWNLVTSVPLDSLLRLLHIVYITG